MSEKILSFSDLSVSFFTEIGEIEAVRNISLDIHKKEILVLAGESGCGKSVLCKSVLKLLPRFAKIKNGSILYNNEDLVKYDETKMRPLRGNDFSMVFQNPLTTLNPSMSMGSQLLEAIRHKNNISKTEAQEKAVYLLEQMGIDYPTERLNMLPGEFSGGQRQRCALAIALAAEPVILFADEPTTALDVTVQTQILDLLMKLRDTLDLTIVLITHDLGVAAKVADRIAIMYAGKIVEIGTVDEIFYDARHPYTWGLLEAMPATAKKGDRLQVIPGMPPDLLNPPQGDAFAIRNRYALQIDYEKMPPFFSISATHKAASWLLDPRAPKIESPYLSKYRGYINE